MKASSQGLGNWNLQHRIGANDPPLIVQKKRRFHLRGENDNREHMIRRVMPMRSVGVSGVTSQRTNFDRSSDVHIFRNKMGINRTKWRRAKLRENKQLLKSMKPKEKDNV